MIISLPSALGVIQIADLSYAPLVAFEAGGVLELEARRVEGVDHGG